MAVRKLKSREGLFVRLLEQKSAAIRRTAADTVREAEEHVVKAEEIVSHSALIVERALKTLDDLGWSRRRRSLQENGHDGPSGTSHPGLAKHE